MSCVLSVVGAQLPTVLTKKILNFCKKPVQVTFYYTPSIEVGYSVVFSTYSPSHCVFNKY